MEFLEGLFERRDKRLWDVGNVVVVVIRLVDWWLGLYCLWCNDPQLVSHCSSVGLSEEVPCDVMESEQLCSTPPWCGSQCSKSRSGESERIWLRRVFLIMMIFRIGCQIKCSGKVGMHSIGEVEHRNVEDKVMKEDAQEVEANMTVKGCQQEQRFWRDKILLVPVEGCEQDRSSRAICLVPSIGKRRSTIMCLACDCKTSRMCWPCQLDSSLSRWSPTRRIVRATSNLKWLSVGSQED
jgi:hypothetical protein